ncbi:hypothetical protein PINS_up000748 [Pythium insidiosum]|nr:hypothetical protein PINS_up000748 [Pythium insidiosum]
MAPNTSSIFNEAPADTKPSSAPSSEPTRLSSATTLTPAATTESSTSTAADCPKQKAPRMESTVDDACDASVRDSLRGPRVAPICMDDLKSPIPFRKSCLKRSSSHFSPPAAVPLSPLAPSCEDGVVTQSRLSVASASVEKKESDQPVQKNRRRCWECKAKIGLTAVTCRCDYTFCNKHRYAEEHNCRFNFKSAAKRKLEEENPRVVPSKIARIN